MKKIIILTCFAFLFYSSAFNQTYITRNGNVSFYSHTPLEDIKAQNNEAVSVLNVTAGTIQFKVAVKSFHFTKTAMEEHFNTNDYMASSTYPRAGFDGKINDISTVDFAKDGSYPVTVNGNLTIRDVTKPVTAKGIITIKNGKPTATATFIIKRKDYNVIGESFVQKKIAEDITITVNCEYDAP